MRTDTKKTFSNVAIKTKNRIRVRVAGVAGGDKNFLCAAFIAPIKFNAMGFTVAINMFYS